MDSYDVAFAEMRKLFPEQMAAFDASVRSLVVSVQSVQAAIGTTIAQQATNPACVREMMFYMNLMVSALDKLADFRLPAEREMAYPQPLQVPEQVYHALYDKGYDATLEVKRAMGEGIAHQDMDPFKAIERDEDRAYEETPVYDPEPAFIPKDPPKGFTLFGQRYQFIGYGRMAHTIISDLYRRQPGPLLQMASSLPAVSPLSKMLSFDTAHMQSAVAIGGGLYLDTPSTREDAETLIFGVFRMLGIPDDEFVEER